MKLAMFSKEVEFNFRENLKEPNFSTYDQEKLKDIFGCICIKNIHDS